MSNESESKTTRKEDEVPTVDVDIPVEDLFDPIAFDVQAHRVRLVVRLRPHRYLFSV